MFNNVVKFPLNVSRKAPARMPRASEIGTPEERAALRKIVVEEIDALGIDPSIDNRLPARSLSVTARNGRLRDQHHEGWRMAEAATRYWRLRIDFEDAVSDAQRLEIMEGSFHPAVDPDARSSMVEKWRAAFVRQLLTPAWDTASVAWKQNALARGKYKYTGLKPARLERAIADDLAFLAAHPVRQSNRRSAKGPTETPPSIA